MGATCLKNATPLCLICFYHQWVNKRRISKWQSKMNNEKLATYMRYSPFSSLPSEGEFCLIFYFVFSDRGKHIFLLSMTWAWCESLMSKWFRVCLSFLDLQILITPLVSSNSSSENNNYKHLESYIEFVMQCWLCRISNPTVDGHIEFPYCRLFFFGQI
jgi:hypothetical protein